MLNFISQSKKGINRDINEDGLIVIKTLDYTLFLVMDGVGQAINSRKAVFEVKKYVRNNHFKYINNNYPDISELMYGAHCHLLAQEIPEVLTTYCLLILPRSRSDRPKISNLGDSRIYGLTNQFIKTLSFDHQLPDSKNIITKCLGMKGISRMDFIESNVLRDYNRFLLCSDGFYVVMEKKLLTFFEIFTGSYLNVIKKHIKNEIKGLNSDDATYILVNYK